MTFANTLLRRLAEWHPEQRETLQVTDEDLGEALALSRRETVSVTCAPSGNGNDNRERRRSKSVVAS